MLQSSSSENTLDYLISFFGNLFAQNGKEKINFHNVLQFLPNMCNFIVLYIIYAIFTKLKLIPHKKINI